MTNSTLIFDPDLSQEQLRGFSRTVAEIEWLLLILVLLYQVVVSPDAVTGAALAMATFFFAAFVLAFHYVNFYRRESYWKLAVETWTMVAFITWVLYYTGRLDSPLLNLYLLVIITSALTLGKLATLLQVLLIAACHAWLGYPLREAVPLSVFTTEIATALAPMMLVAYITTMLSADIRTAYGYSMGRLRTLSEKDALTGVLNVRGFEFAAETVFRQAQRYDRPFSVLMIDSDSLKSVNDGFGHETGNRLLEFTVKCIDDALRKNPMRPHDIVARYGGDEFVVLLPETPCAAAAVVADRIRKTMESTPFMAGGQMLSPTVSIGVACYPQHGTTLEAVLRRADEAMYASKSNGKNRVTAHTH